MRFRRFLCLALLCAVICCGLFSVSAYAAVVEQYSYNGLILPKLPINGDYDIILLHKGSYYCCSLTEKWDAGLGIILNDSFKLIGDEWVHSTDETYPSEIVWSRADVLDGTEVVLPGSEPVVTLIEVPDPPPEPIGPSDIASILDAYTGQITVQLVVTVLAGAAGVSVGLVFLWWGVRKATGALMKAFKKGKLRI